MRSLADLNSGGGGGGQGGAAGGGGGGGCADCIKSMWRNTPFFTRCLFIISVSVYGMSWVTEFILWALFCSP